MDGDVLITGATGWLGLNLLEQIKLSGGRGGGRVRALVRPGEESGRVREILPEAEIIQGDIRKGEDARAFCRDSRGGVLIHTAGIIHPERVRDFYEVNLEGTRKLLVAASEAGLKRIVVVSSNSPCGCNPHPDHLFDENSPYRPYMNYGRSKMQMELAVKQAQAKGEIETVLVRAPWFYGPHQPARQTLFFEMIREGKGPIVGTGRNLRSMADTSRLAKGLLLAARVEKAKGQIYWIADERPYSMIEIIDTIEKLLENEFGQACAHKRMRLPGVASEVAWCVDKFLQGLGIYHQKIHVLSEMNKTIACSVEKAKEELGYEPAQSLEQGMRASMKMIYRGA